MAESIARRRLIAQRLAAPTFQTPAAVVSWLGAVQAQDYLAALWAVGLRMKSATEALVEQALKGRSIIRTWPMRGTLHFIAAADARWMLELLAPRIIAQNARRLKRDFDLDARTLARAEKAVVRALPGGRQMRRDALYQVLDDAGIDSSNQRGLHVFFYLAHQRVICFGAREGKQQTFALLDDWVPAARPWTREESLAELATRYFTSHGPATLRDFTWWSSLTASDAREALSLAKPNLEREEIDGRDHWFAPSSLRPSVPSSLRPSVFLLPAFDEYTVAYRDRDAVLDPAHRKLHSTGYGLLNPAIVIGGRVIGSWKRTLSDGQVVITPALFEPMAKSARDALLPAARRYGQFLGVPAILSPR